MLHISDISFKYGIYTVLNALSLFLRPGEIASLIGNSGSGKTTLFKLITGILKPQTGTINTNQEPNGFHHVSYVTQEDLLLPWRTVLANLTLTSELGPIPKNQKELQESAHQLLDEVGLSAYAHWYPHQLSGGMRQRVSLARALVQNRPILLLDEPFGSLDVSLREQMYELLREINRKHGTTILLITHDFRDALSLSDRILFLSKGSIQKEWSIANKKGYDPKLAEEMFTALSQ